MTTFEIPGQPIAKGRARAGRGGRFYTPTKTVKAEEAVANEARKHFPEPLKGPVRMIVYATFQPAKSWPKKKVAQHINRPHIQKPDSDNVMKLLKDALEGIAFENDSQVADERTVKIWGPTPRTVVHVESMATETGSIM